jgi:hypothetical protein
MRFLPLTMMILLAPLLTRSDVSAPSVYPSVESASRLASTRTSADRATWKTERWVENE